MRIVFGTVLALAVAGTAGASEPDGAAVFLNHFYVVVDDETYGAAQASGFLTREFAPFEKRTTTRNDISYTGIYWYGRRTYFELFAPGPQGGPDASGFALGVERPGESEIVKRAWTAALGGADGGLVTRKTETDAVPWFEMSYARAELGGLRVWLMEYHRDFLAHWYGNLTPARSVTRADVLDRYVARIGPSNERGSALLKDVTGLTVVLSAADRETLTKLIRAAGWTIRDQPGTLEAVGPESVLLRLVAEGDRSPKISEVTFSLQRPVAAQTHRFGSADLRLEGTSARLRFGDPAPGR
ncbi:MAG: hypothetical protein A2V74_03990 [Acidobacteria bacterium RBG_16_70_10]|nr:MAG: hypothetical protein A2V74_03990 [Acidobacteria bacterium RBG_16_70_10]